MSKGWHSEKHMAAIRAAIPGTKEKAKLWVAYMRNARSMGVGSKGARREFADMMRRHLKWPLCMEVMVKVPDGRYLKGAVNGHIGEYPHSCWISFEPVLVDYDGYGARYAAIVPFRSMKPVRHDL